MALRIDLFEWVEELVEKNRAKHGVEIEEVESAILNTDPPPYARKVGEGKYIALAQVGDDGGYLFIVFAMPHPNVARVISARSMTAAEKTEYRKRRAGK